MTTFEDIKREAATRRANSQGGCASGNLTVRDYFAAKAMQSITAVLHQSIRPSDLAAMTRDAYGIADAMMKARSA